jgi:uncharacterized membrane protein
MGAANIAPGLPGLVSATQTARSDRSAMPRVVSVDLLRGAVMILMALDHSHFFFSKANSVPEYLPGSSVPLFFTRWVTHFCAPAFFFLAGTGAFLSLARGGKSISQVSRYLWTRGLWIILMSFTVVGFAWTSLFPYIHGGVLWSLGLSMILLAVLIRLPLRWVGAIGVGIMVSHSFLDRVPASVFGRFAVVWSILHCPGTYSIGFHRYFFTLFTVIPWAGVMAAGYAFGAVMLAPDRQKVMLQLGSLVTAGFFVLRIWNHFGNSAAGLRGAFPDYYSAGPWTSQATLGLTLASFFNTLKYPASLQFLLMTMGPILLMLGMLDKVNPANPVSRIFLVFGRVPFFYYMLHLLFLHTMAVWVAVACHQRAAWLLYGGPLLIRVPPGYGHGLPFIYAMWIVAVCLLYLPCKWLMNLKQRRADWWLRYL